jgi:hypothetical protein
VSTEFATFSDSSASLSDAPALSARMREDGYLFIRGLAPRDALLELRRAILEICRDAGWIDSSSADLMHGKWSGAGPFTEGEPEYQAVYKRIINHPLFLAWPDREEFGRTLAKIAGAPVQAHRLRIGRITFPNNVQQTTGAHQDFQYIRGAADTYTIWTPIGDCPIELGGLAVLRGSHHGGFIEHRFFKEKKYAGHGLADDQLPASPGIEWHAGDFAAGDVLIFHSHTIHKALPNLTKDRLRLSTDNRYTRAGDAIAEISTKSHYGL